MTSKVSGRSNLKKVLESTSSKPFIILKISMRSPRTLLVSKVVNLNLSSQHITEDHAMNKLTGLSSAPSPVSQCPFSSGDTRPVFSILTSVSSVIYTTVK